MSRDGFALSDKERFLWGVRLRGDALRIRPTGWSQFWGLALSVVGCLVLAGALFLPTENLTSPRFLFFPGAAWIFGLGTCGWWPSVIASPADIVVRGLRSRHFEWDAIERFRVVERRVWSGGFTAHRIDVVEMCLRNGADVVLWPTSSSPAGASGDDEPSPAAVKGAILERYRETYGIGPGSSTT